MNITLFHIETKIEEQQKLKNLLVSVERWDFNVSYFTSISAAQEKIKSQPVDLLVVGLNVDSRDLEKQIQQLSQMSPATACIVLAESEQIQSKTLPFTVLQFRLFSKLAFNKEQLNIIIAPIAKQKELEKGYLQLEVDLALQKARLAAFDPAKHIYVIRTDLKGTCTYTNELFQKVFLAPGNNGCGENIRDYIIPDDHLLLFDIIKNTLKNKGEVFSTNLRKAQYCDGKIKNGVWDFVTIEDNAGVVVEIQCIGYDLTAMQCSKLELIKIKEEQELILKNSSSLSLLLDESLVIQVVKGSFNLLSRKADHSLEGQSFSNFILDQDQSNWNAFLAKHSKSDSQGESIKIRLINSDGETFWATIMMRYIKPFYPSDPALYLLTLRDVSKEHRLEKEKNALIIQSLEGLEDLKYYKQVLDKHALVVITDPQGYCLYANDYFSKVCGYKISELIGKTINIIKSDYHSESYHANMWETIRSGSIWQGEAKNKRKDGSFYWVKGTISPKFDKDSGEIVSYISIQTDISAQKETELALTDSQSKHSNTLNSINQEVWSVNKSYQLTIFNNLFKNNFKSFFNFQLQANQNMLEIEVLSLEIRKNYKKRYDHAFKGHSETYLDEYLDPTDHKIKFLEVRVLPTLSQNAKINGATVYSQDITERKEREIELKELLIRFELATKSNNIGIWDFDIPSNKLIWDENMFDLYEIEHKSEMTWDEWTKVMAPDNLPRVLADFKAALDGSPNFSSTFKVNAKNEVKTIASLAKILRDGDGRAYRAIGLNWDITKTVMHEENLRQSLAENEDILSSINDGFLVLDQQLRVLRLNKSACKILNVNAADVIGKSLWPKKEDQEDSKFYPVFKKCLLAKESGNVIGVDRVSKNWIDARAHPQDNGLVIFFKDITIQMNKSMELDKVQNNRAALINTTFDLIWSINTNFELVAFNNPFSRHQTQIGLATPIEGGSVFNKHNQAYIKRWEIRYEKALAGDTFTENIVENNLTYYLSLYPIFNAHNKIEGVACYARDVSETEAYLNAIEKQNNQLKDIAWMQSHIVRAPVARILGLVELINEEKLATDPDLNSYLQSIHMSAQELDTIVEKITEKTYSAKIKGI